MSTHLEDTLKEAMITQDKVTIRTPKRLDWLVANHLVDDLNTKLCAGRRIVLDLSQTEAIDTKGSDALLQGVLMAKQRGAKVSLRRVHPQIGLALKMAGVLHHFNKSA